jgi:hypothetical protein
MTWEFDTTSPENAKKTKTVFAILGGFYVAWSAVQPTIDIGIGDTLKLSDQDCHILTTGIDLTKKVLLLKQLMSQGQNAKKAEINRCLNIILNESKRNIIAHSYIQTSGDDSVIFLEKGIKDGYSSTRHEFTIEKFYAHTQKIADACSSLEKLLGVDSARLTAFLAAVPRKNGSRK